MSSSLQPIAAAIERNLAVLRRRPSQGVHDDAPATVSWQGGVRMLASHANGTRIATDMPTEIGGSGDQVTPGWLFRAGLAACGATSVVMAAAAAGIELTQLDVKASSRSDTCGLLGMVGADGAPVYGGPSDVRLAVRVAAPGVDAASLRALVHEALARSPIPSAVEHETPLVVEIEVG
jgi:uncharacterized OsmC-like protein